MGREQEERERREREEQEEARKARAAEEGRHRTGVHSGGRVGEGHHGPQGRETRDERDIINPTKESDQRDEVAGRTESNPPDELKARNRRAHRDELARTAATDKHEISIEGIGGEEDEDEIVFRGTRGEGNLQGLQLASRNEQRSEGVEGAGQEMAGCGEANSFSIASQREREEREEGDEAREARAAEEGRQRTGVQRGGRDAEGHHDPKYTLGEHDGPANAREQHELELEFITRGLENVAMNTNLQIIKNSDLEELRELGSGSFGTVYQGRWRCFEVAIKKLHKCGDASEHSRKREEFLNEVARLASVHHPNIVAFYGVVVDGAAGSVATVTEYVPDGSLRQALQMNRKFFDKGVRTRVALDIASTMQYLHEQKIIHFDLKSENLLLDVRNHQHPVCKICDFGLSKARLRTLVTGGIRGTLAWMAPELLDGFPVSEKVDVYSFGIVMWELLTGEEPYADLHHGTILGMLAKQRLRPDVPECCDPEWKSLMVQCWSEEPSDRPSFSEIAKRLKALLSTS